LVEFAHLHVAEDGAMASKIGLSKAAVRHGLAADEDVPHGGMMAVGTDSCLEIDVRTMFGALSCTGVDLEAE
jgi:hypothetical protein